MTTVIECSDTPRGIAIVGSLHKVSPSQLSTIRLYALTNLFRAELVSLNIKSLLRSAKPQTRYIMRYIAVSFDCKGIPAVNNLLNTRKNQDVYSLGSGHSAEVA
ncbi:MAG: hypothetical protein WBB28_02195 [Crinalium sp.]